MQASEATVSSRRSRSSSLAASPKLMQRRKSDIYILFESDFVERKQSDRSVHEKMGFRVAVVYFLAQTLYLLLISGGAVAKAVEFGWVGYVQHFTNWSWTLQIAFYALTLPFVAYPSWAASVVAVAFLPLVTVILTVWLGSSILLLRDGNFLKGVLGKWPAGVVVVGNDVLHVLPVIVILLFSWIMGRLVFYGLRSCLAGILHGPTPQSAQRPIYLLAAVMWQVWGGALAVVGLYRIFFDPNTVYDTDLPETQALGLVLLVGFVVGGGAICVLSVFYGLLRPFPKGNRRAWAAVQDRRVLLTDFEASGAEIGTERLWETL